MGILKKFGKGLKKAFGEAKKRRKRGKGKDTISTRLASGDYFGSGRE